MARVIVPLVSAMGTTEHPGNNRGVDHLVRAWFAAVALLAGWFYLHVNGGLHVSSRAEDLYSVQLQAWYDGHTYLGYVPDPALARLKNPYDARLNQPYRLLDLCYYQNRYYSYFGVAPIILIGLPWHWATGTFLKQGSIVFVFVYGSLLLSLYIVYHLWRAYLRAIPFGVVAVASGLLVIGNLGLLHLLVGNFYQVAQSGANFCQLASLAAGLLALRHPRRWRWWLGLASLAAGFAVASRPSFLFGGISLLPICAVVAQRNRGQRPDRPAIWCWIQPLLMAAWPAALICAGLLWHNWIRFGSVGEFGSSYILAGVDPRTLKLFSLGYVYHNVVVFLSNSAATFHYFPFYHDLVYPVGLNHFPFVFLAGAVALAAGRCARRTDPELTGGVLTLLLASLGTFASVAGFVECWLRYEVDFFVPSLLAATVGWLCLYRRFGHKPMARRAVAILGSLLAVTTAVNVLLVAAAVCPPERLAAISRMSNRLVGWIDAARGYSYGPVRLQLSMAGTPRNERERLIATGPQGEDSVYFQPAGDGKIMVGYDHRNVGGPVSAAFAAPIGGVHTVDISMGSLLPADNQAFFDGWTESDIYRAKHLLRVGWDGRPVLEASCDFYPAGPNEVEFGDGASGRPSAPKSGWAIQGVQRRSFEQRGVDQAEPDFQGYARFDVRFGENRAERREPVLATGGPGAADLLYVHYLPDGRLRFGVDNWNGGLFEGDPFKGEAGRLHTVYLSFGSLYGGGRTSDDFVLVLDGRPVARTRFPFYPTRLDRIVWGLNSVHSSVAGGMFSGTLSGITAITKAEFDRHYSQPDLAPGRITGGKISLTVRFDYVSSRAGQPLVVTGKTGAGDFIYVVYDSDREVHFGFDHWGSGGLSGPAVPLDFSRSHIVVVTMGSLHDLGTAAKPDLETVRVTLDGRIALEGRAACYPTSSQEIEIGRNDIGGSSCALILAGEVRAVDGGR